MRSLVVQYSMKTDQYPKTMTDAVDVMAKHPFDPNYYERTKKAREKNKHNDSKPSQTTPQLAQSKGYHCHICGGKDIQRKNVHSRACQEQNGLSQKP